MSLAVWGLYGKAPLKGPKPETEDSIAYTLERGRKKFPGNRFLLAALQEEVGEVARALLQKKPQHEVVAEALQVAAIAIRIAEEGDASFVDVTDEEAKT